MDAGLGLYVLAAAALIATPGQDMLYVVSRALAQGRLAGLASAFGVCLGILVHTALAALGVGALLQASDTLFAVLKLAGAAYLAWLGIRLLREPPLELARGEAVSRQSIASLVAQGMFSNVSNPKMVVFFMAFLPQFVDPASAHPTLTIAALGALYAAMALPMKAAVALAAASLARRAGRTRVLSLAMNRVGGALLLGLGARLAFDGAR